MTTEYIPAIVPDMTAFKSPPLAIRLPPELVAAVEERCGIPAGDRNSRAQSGQSRTAVIERMLMRYIALCNGTLSAEDITSLDAQELKVAKALAVQAAAFNRTAKRSK